MSSAEGSESSISNGPAASSIPPCCTKGEDVHALVVLLAQKQLRRHPIWQCRTVRKDAIEKKGSVFSSLILFIFLSHFLYSLSLSLIPPSSFFLLSLSNSRHLSLALSHSSLFSALIRPPPVHLPFSPLTSRTDDTHDPRLQDGARFLQSPIQSPSA